MSIANVFAAICIHGIAESLDALLRRSTK